MSGKSSGKVARIDSVVEVDTTASKSAERVRVWFVNHYAEPPQGMATRPFEIAQRLTERGIDVTIFASDFGHYHHAYIRRLGLALWRAERIGGVRFIWVHTSPYRGNGLTRIVNMAVFAVLALTAGIMQAERPDSVIGVTTHPLAGLSGWILAVLKRARFFYEVTDLWPETLIQFGRLDRDGWLARILRRLERFLYDRAERIIMLWRDTSGYVRSTGADPRKIVWIPHGVARERLTLQGSYDGRVHGSFNLMFLGGFNSANSIGTLINAAAVLAVRGRHDIRFELVGAGTEKQHWMRYVQERGIPNLSFPAPVPKSKVPQVLARADALVYGLQDLPLYRYGITLNKLFDYLASGRPIIFYGRSSYDPVALADAGIVVPPGDPDALADAIERMAALAPAERVRLGSNGYRFLLANHVIEDLAERYIQFLTASGPAKA